MLNYYEQKLEDKRQRYLDLAAKKHSEANALSKQSHDMAKTIPFGQPILVGHYSEKSDRNYRNKIENKMSRAIEVEKTASYYEEKASTLGKSGISSDDPDAIKKLQKKLAGLETLQKMMKAANKAVKKNDIEALHNLGYNDRQIAKLKAPDFCGRIGYASYALTNNNANIRSIKERITRLEKATTIEPKIIKCENSGYTYKEEDNRCQFVFDGKPEEEIRNILKANAFKWSPTRNAWVRQLTNNGQYAARRVTEKLQAIL